MTATPTIGQVVQQRRELDDNEVDPRNGVGDCEGHLSHTLNCRCQNQNPYVDQLTMRHVVRRVVSGGNCQLVGGSSQADLDNDTGLPSIRLTHCAIWSLTRHSTSTMRLDEFSILGQSLCLDQRSAGELELGHQTRSRVLPFIASATEFLTLWQSRVRHRRQSHLQPFV